MTASLLAAISLSVQLASAESTSDSCEERHPMGNAWWTGPMLANTAATAPRGHYLVEPYLFDVSTQGSFDAHGNRKSAPHANQYGSLTYFVYGLTDKTGVGFIPVFAYNQVSNAPGGSGIGVGDITLQLQRRVAQFEPCRWIPTVSVTVQETLPTGKYDQLGTRTSDGLGSGAYTTNFATYSQMYFWMPNRRILRTRLNVSDSVSSSVTLRDVSVYGTSAGFRGTASPGRTLVVDLSAEYSATRSWVLALDALYRHSGNTRITGSNTGQAQSTLPIRMDSGSSVAYGFAPAVEYSWKPYLGVLVGVRVIPAGHNTSETITPAIAINFVH